MCEVAHANLHPRPRCIARTSDAKALDILLKAGIYAAAEGGGTINDRPLVLVDVAHVPEAVAALNKAGLRTIIG